MLGLIEEIPPMSRHLVNLESIFGDLESRYGPEDGMVLEVKSEIDSCKSLAHEKHPGLFARETNPLHKTRHFLPLSDQNQAFKPDS